MTNPNPASAAFEIREFSIVQRNAAGAITGVQNPWAEIDYKTSGGHDQYNALQTRAQPAIARGSQRERPVHAGQEHRQHGRVERSRHGGQQRQDAR